MSVSQRVENTQSTHAQTNTQYVQGGPKKCSHKSTARILSNFNWFSYFFSPEDSFALNWLLKIPPLLACDATRPPCETLMPENKRLTILRVDGEEMGDQHDQECSYIFNVRWTCQDVYCSVCQWKKLKSAKYLAKLQARTWLHKALSSCGGIFNNQFTANLPINPV